MIEDERAAVSAARAGDSAAFAALVEPHRHELRVHCYRMLGSFTDAEDLVQETMLRAWRGLPGFEGRSSVRAWLYKIATNACIDDVRRPARVLPHDLEPPSAAPSARAPRPELPWLEPYPDHLLDLAARPDTEPEAAAVRRETIELAFLVAIQHLPPRQRAVLIFRDVLGWPARETAGLLGLNVGAVTSALQRARAGLRRHLPERRADWSAAAAPTREESALLRRYMDAFERSDADGLAALMHTDVHATMPPYPYWFLGRETLRTAWRDSFDPRSPRHVGQLRLIPAAANRQPAAAVYARLPGEDVHRAFGLGVLRVSGGLVTDLTAFGPELFPAFGLPPVLPGEDGG